MLKYRVLPIRKHTRIQSPMNQPRFGCQTEKLDDIAGQLTFFNEVEANYNGTAPEPARWIAEKHVIKGKGHGTAFPKRKACCSMPGQLQPESCWGFLLS